MREIFRKNKVFFIPYILLFLVSHMVILSSTKGELHRALTASHHKFSDQVFSTITWLGHGSIILLVAAILICMRIRWSVLIVSVFALSGLTVQILKRFVFFEAQRPKLYFQGKYDIHVVSGVDLHSFFSFPSGHTASAFGLFLCLILITRNTFLKSIYFLLAVLTGYSRVYLSQHFLVDVVYGSLVGIIFSVSCFIYIERINNNWIDSSLQAYLKRSHDQP